MAGAAALAFGSLAGAMTPNGGLKCDEQRADRACEIRESNMAATGQLNVDASPNGGVSVKAWDKNEILVRAKVEAWADSKSEAQSRLALVKVITEGNKVYTKGPDERGQRNRGWSASFEIFVPAHTGLDMNSVNGGMHVEGVNGAMNLRTVNGGIHLSDVAGNVKGETVNGGVHVTLSGARWSGGLDLHTVNGGVTVAVPDSVNAAITAQTVHGGISSDFSGARITKGQWGAGPNSLELNLGSGGAPIKLETVNGGVHVQRRSA
jgi:hypothetical protein